MRGYPLRQARLKRLALKEGRADHAEAAGVGNRGDQLVHRLLPSLHSRCLTGFANAASPEISYAIEEIFLRPWSSIFANFVGRVVLSLISIALTAVDQG